MERIEMAAGGTEAAAGALWAVTGVAGNPNVYYFGASRGRRVGKPPMPA